MHALEKQERRTMRQLTASKRGAQSRRTAPTTSAQLQDGRRRLQLVRCAMPLEANIIFGAHGGDAENPLLRGRSPPESGWRVRALPRRQWSLFPASS